MKKILISVLLSLPYFSPLSVFAKHSYNTANEIENQKSIEKGMAEDHSSGEWVAIEQQLTSKGGTQQGLETFENFTWHDSHTNKVDNTQQFGFEYIGLDDTHPKDTIGCAMNRVHLNPHFVKAQTLQGKHQFDASAEYNMEVNYSCNLNKWLMLRPDLQYVIHPGATHKVGNAFVLGLSTKVVF